jgi:predicted GNAT family N-acyltransferase
MEKKRELSINIKLLDPESSQDLEDAFHVRREVFIKEQNVPEEEEFDEIDLKSFHVILYESDRPVATGRLLKAGEACGEAWFIGRISVLKAFRGKNAGKLLVDKLLEKAAEQGAGKIYIHAQTHAVRFYEKFGFVPYGDIFPESGIEHISMVKKF